MKKSWKNLSKIDSYMQENAEEEWEKRSGVPDCYSGSDGWEGVEKNNPEAFKIAWIRAMIFIEEHNFVKEEIEKS
jgi:hypothetical protein